MRVVDVEAPLRTFKTGVFTTPLPDADVVVSLLPDDEEPDESDI